MYLKQLVCKGFKSFADRSVLELEPGVTAVVGPNGSGKSNISDAVLWVLGERNAKNLRGQVMEDVIFAGSSARKSVGVAEVSLVLDNSDGSLPVDYDEVTISRRMYRSGESEYLINGSTVRRLDVLDILHDSGLGTGTHSIISQGHLDSILQSKPEDRRALIEEAAGVLKHKQRKEKSQRKIAQMDLHLARVNDIVVELERQLGPLQRKARRAIQYKEISAQLDQVKLALAVDNLRSMQNRWDALGQEEADAQTLLDKRKAHVAALEKEYDAIQEQIKAESSDVARLVQLQSRAASASDRFDSLGVLLKERRRSAEQRSAELNQELETNAAKRVEAQEERRKAAEKLEQAQSARNGAQAQLDAAQKAYDAAHDERLRLEQELISHQRARGSAEREAEMKRKQLAATQERLARSEGQAQAAKERLVDIEQRIEEASLACQKAKQGFDDAQHVVAQTEKDEQRVSALMLEQRAERDELRKRTESIRAELSELEAELKGIKEVERALLAAAGPAHAWVAQQRREDWGELRPLLDCLEVSAGFETLVERVLGDDVTALLVEDTQRVRAIGRALSESSREGMVTLVTGVRDSGHSLPEGCVSLLDHVTCNDELKPVVFSLLGDVVVSETLDQALAIAGESVQPIRVITRDGAIVWPSGKVQLCRQTSSQGGQNLVRARRLKEIESLLGARRDELSRVQSLADDAARRAAETQDESLQLRQQLASARGQMQSAQHEYETLSRRVSQVQSEKADSLRAQEAAALAVSQCMPEVDSMRNEIADIEGRIDAAKQAASEVREKLNPLRDKEQGLATSLADAKVSFATLAERETYAARTMDERSKELLRLSADDDQAFAALSQKTAARKRINPLLEVIAVLQDGAREKAIELSSQVAKAQESSVTFHEHATDAREAVRNAHALFDQANEQMSQMRVEKGRLELQVQASVDFIVQECHSTMEEALKLPVLEDRAAAEEESFRLQKRISNLGVINPDAAQEYDELKERYDYLKAQLADLASARAALKKIDRVIDERMKEDFVTTFHTVNGYFKEIFAELFPGGSAELSLCDPEDLENTGVEVTAQPRGKRITKMTLMSGGEKSLVACALLFAVYRTRTTPFYILDEIEAALDDTNLRRLVAYLEDLSKHTQLIMITHQRRTMEMADVLFGVSMQADGVTRVISQRLDKALQYAE